MAEKENKNASAKSEVKANKKPGFFARLGKWFKSVKSEFNKITWSSRKTTLKNFGIVMAIVVASALVIGLVDVGLGALLNLLYEVV